MTSLSATYPSLQNRTVVITGGASGIGASMVRALVRQGARVAFLDVQDDAALELVAELSPSSVHSPLYLHCDLQDIPLLQKCLADIQLRFGGVQV